MLRMAYFVVYACEFFYVTCGHTIQLSISDRYEAKMILEPPDVLIEPNFDFLVRHCMTMHPTVWDDLRRKV